MFTSSIHTFHFYFVACCFSVQVYDSLLVKKDRYTAQYSRVPLDDCQVLHCSATHCAVICSVLACSALLSVLCYAVLCCTVLCCAVQYYTVLYSTLLYCALPCGSVHSHAAPPIMLDCTALHCTVFCRDQLN